MKRTIAILLGCSVLVSTQVVVADEALKKGLAKAQYMLRQSTAEKVAVQKKLDAAKQEAEAKEQALANKEKGLKKAEKKIAKLKSTIDVWQKEYEALKKQLAETRAQLRKADKYGQAQLAKLETQTQNFELCEIQNYKLVKISESLLDSYANKSVGDALKQNDPFFGLKQVEIENLLQDYEHRIEDHNLELNQHLVQKVEEFKVSQVTH